MASATTRGGENEPEAHHPLTIDRRDYLACADAPKYDKQVENRSGIPNASIVTVRTAHAVRLGGEIRGSDHDVDVAARGARVTKSDSSIVMARDEPAQPGHCDQAIQA